MPVSRPANPPLPSLWTVRGIRTAVLRTPREAKLSTARHVRRARDRDEGPVAAEELRTQGCERGALLGDRPREGIGTAEVAGEGQVDHPVGPGSAGVTRRTFFRYFPDKRGPGRTAGSERVAGLTGLTAHRRAMPGAKARFFRTMTRTVLGAVGLDIRRQLANAGPLLASAEQFDCSERRDRSVTQGG